MTTKGISSVEIPGENVAFYNNSYIWAWSGMHTLLKRSSVKWRKIKDTLH